MTLKEMEAAITKLSPKELDELMRWFGHYYAQMMEKKHAVGYAKNPPLKNDTTEWESEQNWGES